MARAHFVGADEPVRPAQLQARPAAVGRIGHPATIGGMVPAGASGFDLSVEPAGPEKAGAGDQEADDRPGDLLPAER